MLKKLALAGALCCALAISAWAQSVPAQDANPAASIFAHGHITTGTEWLEFAKSKQDYGGDGSALTVGGFPLAVMLANGGLSTNQTLTGSGWTNACPTISANCIYIGSDNSSSSGGAGQVEALSIFHNYGGTGTAGGRNSLSIWSLLTAATDSSNTNRNYVAGQFYARAMASDGGTDTGSGAKGAIFGINPYGILDGTATNFVNVTGGEVNVAIKSGGSSRIKSGWSISALPVDAVQGTSYDAALMVSNQTGAVGWKNGIYFSASNGVFPLDSTATVLKTSGASFTNGIDFSSNTITGYAWQSPGFTVTGIGVVYIGQQLQMGSNIGIDWQGRSLLSSPADGKLLMTNQASTGFTGLQLGGTTSSFPGLFVNGSKLETKVADGSADTGLIVASLSTAIATKTASYTATATDSSLIFNCAASCTLTLPSASANTGLILRVRTIAAFTVVSASANVVPLAGGSASTAILAATAGKWALLQSDGTSWLIMEAN
jgi:hypothetical protein